MLGTRLKEFHFSRKWHRLSDLEMIKCPAQSLFFVNEILCFPCSMLVSGMRSWSCQQPSRKESAALPRTALRVLVSSGSSTESCCEFLQHKMFDLTVWRNSSLKSWCLLNYSYSLAALDGSKWKVFLIFSKRKWRINDSVELKERDCMWKEKLDYVD